MSIEKAQYPLRPPCGLPCIGFGGMFIRNANLCTNNLSDHKPSLDNRSTRNPGPSPNRTIQPCPDSGPDNGPNSGSYRTARTHTDSLSRSQLLRRRTRYRRSHQLRLAA